MFHIMNVMLVVRQSIWNHMFGIAMMTLCFLVVAHTKLYFFPAPALSRSAEAKAIVSPLP